MPRRLRLRSRRAQLSALVLVLALAGGVFAFLKYRGRDQGVTVQTEEVRRGEVVEMVAATGRVQPQTEVKISANVSGRIEKLGVKDGDRVEIGQMLVEIDPTRYAALVSESEAGLRSARAEARLAAAHLEQAQRDYDRRRQVHAQGLGSAGDLENAETNLKVAAAQRDAANEAVSRAEALLVQTRDDRAKTTILAPKEGIVTQLNVEVGEVVLGTTQNVGTTLMTIADLSRMEVLAEIDESEVVKVSLGDSARIELDALTGRSFSGSVSEIANSATTRGRGSAEESTHFEVKVALHGDVAALRPGMTATLDVMTERRDQVINLPIQCVTLRPKPGTDVAAGKGDKKGGQKDGRRHGGDEGGGGGPRQAMADPAPAGGTPGGGGHTASNLREVVYIVRDGVAREVPVETGISSPTHIEILNGEIREGDEVVSGSYRILARELAEGDRVIVDNESLRRGGGGNGGGGGEGDGGERAENDGERGDG
jgi:HlyD family secretion protein